MTKLELRNTIRELVASNNEVLGEIYFVLKTEPLSVMFADIEEITQKELSRQFLNQLSLDILNNEELSILNLSNADNRSNVMYEYDLEHKPEEFNMFELIRRDTSTFNFRGNSLSDVKGILVKYSFGEHKLILYKHNHSVSVIRKDSTLNIIKLGNSERLAKLSSDILKISSSYDIFKLDDKIMIKTMKVLEHNFKFHDVVKSTARESIEVLREVDLIENPDDLEDMLENVTFARKLLSVTRTSPVLGTIPNTEIINFVNRFPGLNGKFELSDDLSKIKLTTKKSKELLIKLLNDDFLQSELTNHFYSSMAKDSIV